jgi:hypothetical protein
LLLKNTTTEDTDTDGGHGSRLVDGHITDGILGAAYKVHSKLGPDLLERPYKACLCYELARRGFTCEAEKSFPVVYEDITIPLGYPTSFPFTRRNCFRI